MGCHNPMLFGSLFSYASHVFWIDKSKREGTPKQKLCFLRVSVLSNVGPFLSCSLAFMNFSRLVYSYLQANNK